MGEATASAEWRRAAERASRDVEGRRAPPREERWAPDELIEAPAPRPVGGAKPGRRRRGHVPQLSEDVASELADAGGTRHGPRLVKELATAAEAYQAGRDQDALRILRPLLDAAPTAAAVRELHGLTLYRLGRWRAAKAELEACRRMTGSVDHLPVIADCERALGRHQAVDAIWEELRQASPGVEVLSEGRLVRAGSLADRGRLEDAIAELTRYEADRNRPKEWHLRTWYALADLYERAGNVPRARELFRRLVARDAEFFDAAERLAALR